MILGCDVGGTKTAVGLFRREGDALEAIRTRRYASRDYESLEPILREFLGERHEVRSACIGVAGPIERGQVDPTNLPWRISAGGLSRALEIPRVRLVNDLVATAEGIPLLAAADVVTLQEGDPLPDASGLLVAAGTGLGVALLVHAGGALVPLPSEGGHASFAPADPEQDGLLAFLRRRFGHVSAERVVSGPGLVHAYEYLGERGFAAEPEVERRRQSEDPARLVTELALARRSPRCARALELFVAAYGSLAGSLALVALARAGVWIGGGIAPKILPLLRSDLFREAFVAKGRFRPYLEEVPLHVIENDDAALWGAARCAGRAQG